MSEIYPAKFAACAERKYRPQDWQRYRVSRRASNVPGKIRRRSISTSSICRRRARSIGRGLRRATSDGLPAFGASAGRGADVVAAVGAEAGAVAAAAPYEGDRPEQGRNREDRRGEPGGD